MPRTILLALLVLLLAEPGRAEELSAEIVEHKTPSGVVYATLGGKPPRPAPTLFVFAKDYRGSLAQPRFLQAGALLRPAGWLCVSLDLPCHGADQRPGEPAGLAGWRKRVDAGQDPLAEFAERCRAALDHLVAQGYSDPSRVAACGTSRGGYAALRLAAADARVRAAIGYSPVTDLQSLSEFAGAEQAPFMRELALTHRAPELAQRAVCLLVGDRDETVGTDRTIGLARAISAAAAAEELPAQTALHVLASPGHNTPAGSAELSAAWLAKTLPEADSPVAPPRAEGAGEIVEHETREGVAFATLGDKPAAPAPTLFVFATDFRTSLSQPTYLQAGGVLRKAGWLCVSLDLPCHGAEMRPGEPGGLAGWRARIEAGQNPMVEFTARCRAALDHLIAEGYTDATRVAACGTSRGGFSALHLAAADARVRAAIGYAPVSDLKALREFQGAEPLQLVRELALHNRAASLSKRAVWITIGDRDERVSTEQAISLARAISTAAATASLPGQVELSVLPSVGHNTPAGAAAASAAWLERVFSGK